MNRTLFDTNVLLDIALARPEFADESMAAFAHAVSQGQPPLIAPHSLATFYYLVRQSHGNETARRSVADLLTTSQVAEFDHDGALAAEALDFADFEDAMIAACARAAGADCIVTRNQSDFRNSPVEVCSPGGFLQK
jgi:predicted nucleic acid-binding protein